jgi:hypothetical protein
MSARSATEIQTPRKRWWPAKQNTGPCSVDGCSNSAATAGMCNMHYLRGHRYGTTGPTGTYREYHALTGTKEYQAWQNMLARCRNPQHPSYPRYGGRGIKVCAKWSRSFSAFLTDVGPAPSPSHSIDRIDNDGNYEPSNCRWVLSVENARNKASTKLNDLFASQIRNLAFIGMPSSWIAKHFGISPRLAKNVIDGKRWAPRPGAKR